MENVTHTLTGYFLARAGLDRQTPHATAICILAANIPDIDLVTFTSPINYLNYHRHLTHSLFAVPAMGALAVAFVSLWLRLFRRNATPVHWKSAWPIATLVALTHPLLDLLNAYGMRLWLPFDVRWQSWDVLFVWEPWLWAWMFPLSLWLALVRRRQPSPGNPSAPARIAGLALAGLLAFIALKAALHDRAFETIAGLARDAEPVQRIAAFPNLSSPFRWTGLIETPDEYLMFTLDGVGLTHSNPRPRTEGPRVFSKLSLPAEARHVLETGVAADYLRFAQYAAGTMDPTSDGYRIHLFDLRFRHGDNQGFACTVFLDHDFQKVAERFQWR